MNAPKKAITQKVILPDDLEAVYSNIVRISHSPAEMIFDFAQVLPGQKTSKVISRILMSPVGAKMFYKALGNNLAHYEAAFGKIQLPGGSSLAQDLFGSINPPEPPDSEK